MDRILHEQPSLKAYFLSKSFSDKKFERLDQFFTNPLLEPALPFQSNTIQFFTHFYLLLEIDEAAIHILRESIERLAKRLANRVVEPETLRRMKSTVDLDLNHENNLLILGTLLSVYKIILS